MSDRYEGQTYYELLEIKTNAAPAEVYAAYQRARSTYSPSSPALYTMFTPEEAQALMALIEEAYQTLSHQARRKEYDTKLGLTPHAPVKPTGKPVIPVQPASSSSSSSSAGHASSEAWVGPVKVTVGRKEETPQGFARTKFSTYEVKPEMERKIADMKECDGQFLQSVRLYKGVTLDQLSDAIRVTKSTLVALESNDVGALPVAVFTRGFVTQFARALALDERKVVDAYMTFFKARKV